MSETPRYTVVHTDAAPNGDWSIESEMLGAAGAKFVPTRSASEDELIANTRDADALVVGLANVSRRVINELARAKVIVRYGVGYDSVDIPAATERGIPVCNIPDYYTEEVANHALALLLAVNRL
jgi:D-3-phosphoglycerate dehydrogenase